MNEWSEASEQRNWIEGCQCGRDTVVRNAAYVVSEGREPCNARHPHEDMPRVTAELGWCGCGIGADIDVWMRDYLAGCLYPEMAEPGDRSMLLAYMADDLGWTEHGTYIGGAWLTEAGHEALRNLVDATG